MIRYQRSAIQQRFVLRPEPAPPALVRWDNEPPTVIPPNPLTRRFVGSFAAALGSFAVLLAACQPAAAICNIIPGTANSFRANLGTLDRPFASPGDVVEVRVSPACDQASPDLAATAAQHVVSVVFTPPNGPVNAIVLADDCAAIAWQLAACGLPSDRCQTTSFELSSRDCPNGTCEITPNGDQCLGGEDDGAPCQRRLRFPFPDSDSFVGTPDDDRTFSGPAAIAVTAVGAPLPCPLINGGARCADQSGVIACADALFEFTCVPTEPRSTFTHFTALPPPNSYQDICTTPDPPCTGLAPELRFAIDVAGNILVPMDWRGVLIGQGVPIARLLQGSTNVESFSGSGVPVSIPSNDFLASFSPEGGRVAPVFDPQAATATDLTLFGTADAPAGVLRIARISPNGLACAGGDRIGLPCTTETECPLSTCEAAPTLFDFSDRLVSGVGPVVIPQANYQASAKDPVPLDGLVQTQQLLGTVIPESIQRVDLNGDSDFTDDVLTVRDRQTGELLTLGSQNGRAVTRVHEAPFSYPAVEATDTVVTFLESEPQQSYADVNGDGDVFDSTLRLFNVTQTQSTDLLGGTNLAVDATPLIGGRTLAISGGKVFVRASESRRARQHVVRASVSSSGEQGNNHSHQASVSGDGRWVAFVSYASNLVAGDTNNACDTTSGFGGGMDNCPDVFVHDLQTGATVRVSVDSNGTQTVLGFSWQPSLSHDGRFVSFYSSAPNLPPPGTGGIHVFVRDRDADGNGVFDEPGPGNAMTTMMDVRSDGTPAPGDSGGNYASGVGNRALSPDGRFVLFGSHAPLVDDDTNGFADLYIRDRDLDQNGIFDEPGLDKGLTERVSLKSDGSQLTIDTPANVNGGIMSADGRFVAFGSTSPELLPPGSPADGSGGFLQQVLLRDRVTGVIELMSVASDGSFPNGACFHATISSDGRYVVFTCWATNMVAGDTNGARDVFVRDRQHGITQRLSVGSAGEQGSGDSEQPMPSADGRFVVFRGPARNLVPNTTDTGYQTYIHDRLTSMTERISDQPDGTESAGGSFLPLSGNNVVMISADADTVVFSSTASDLTSDPKTNYTCDDDWFDDPPVNNVDRACSDVFAYHADITDPLGADLTGDGLLSATVLQAIDSITGEVTTLCPAGEASVSGSTVAFLRPEGAGSAQVPCPPGSALIGGNPVLNDDGDAVDEVAHLWRGTDDVENLHCAAIDLALSATHLAVLVSETAQGEGSLNGPTDGDSDDAVVKVYDLSTPPPATCDDWISTGVAADTLAITGTIAVFLTPEGAQGEDLNEDGDFSDRVLQVFDAATQTLTNTHQAAEEFVVGPTLVAFRTSEASQDQQDLNGDGDELDAVLQVYDLTSNQLLSSGQAAITCQFEACDPRFPYRVLNDTVRFLTLESQQGEDLNGNDSATDLVLQTFNVRIAAQQGNAPLVTAMSSLQRFARTQVNAVGTVARALTTTGAVSTGICTNTGESCATSANCGAGICFVPPGGCVENLGTPCNPSATGACGAEPLFCQPTFGSPGAGTCARVQNPCASDADCTGSARCNDADQGFQRLVGPLAAVDTGAETFPSSGQCVDASGPACAGDTDCPPGSFCSGEGSCLRTHRTCLTNDDCPQPAQCKKTLLIVSAPDSDGDELADPFDNCPAVANVTQEDSDGDGNGDLCDPCLIDATDTCCPPSPAVCTGGFAKGFLLKKESAGEEELVAKMLKGPLLNQSDFGNPLSSSGTKYTLCIYNDTPALVSQIEVDRAGDNNCSDGSHACWSSVGASPPAGKGYKYKDNGVSSDGTKKILLKGGPASAGKSKIVVKGMGTGIPAGATALLTSTASVTLQLRGDNAPQPGCWSMTLSTIKEQTSEFFKAK